MDTLTVTPATVTDNQRWVDGFAERSDLQTGASALVSFRQNAIDQLSKTSFPTRRDEDWRYSDFTRALNEAWSLQPTDAPTVVRKAYEIPDFDCYVLVTIDGEYQPSLSDEVPGLVCGTIEDLLSDSAHGAWISERLSALSSNENAFVSLNAAFAKTSLFLSIGKNQKLEKPIHIIHLATRNASKRFLNSQVFVRIPQGAELTVDETFETLGQGEAIFRNHVIRGSVDAQGRLEYRSIQNEGRNDYHISNANFDQAGGGFIDHARVDLGGARVRNNLDINHKGPGLETRMAGLFFARGRQKIDNQTFLDHAFPHGESNELYKGIVMDQGVTSFNGKVMVRIDAQKTNAYQQNDNLVIGTKAEANAKPQLEIFADDVKCSHGATIGQMDEAPLFYLMARGINKGTALGMLQRGFLLEVLETIKSEAVRAYVEHMLMSKFNEA
ncbi:MAG: Fe-S cluster assembly protein SufD [Saprospiraceae bacterium]